MNTIVYISGQCRCGQSISLLFLSRSDFGSFFRICWNRTRRGFLAAMFLHRKSGCWFHYRTMPGRKWDTHLKHILLFENRSVLCVFETNRSEDCERFVAFQRKFRNRSRRDTGIIESHDAVACYEGFECSRYCFLFSHGVSFCLAVVINELVESLSFALFPAARRGSALSDTRTLTHGCPNSCLPQVSWRQACAERVSGNRCRYCLLARYKCCWTRLCWCRRAGCSVRRCWWRGCCRCPCCRRCLNSFLSYRKSLRWSRCSTPSICS